MFIWQHSHLLKSGGCFTINELISLYNLTLRVLLELMVHKDTLHIKIAMNSVENL